MPSIALLNILWRRKWIVVWAFVSTVAGAGWTLWNSTPLYEAVARATIDPGLLDPVDETPFISSRDAVGVFQGNMITLARSRRVALDVVKKMGLSRSSAALEAYRSSNAPGKIDIDEWLAEEVVSKHVRASFAESSGPSYILHIAYGDGSPDRAAIFANAFLASFTDAAIEMKTSLAQHGAAWYAPQIEKATAALQKTQAALTRAMERSQSLPVAAQGGDSSLERTAAANATSALSAAKAQLTAMESLLAGSADARAFSNEAETTDSKTLAGLRDELLRAEAEIARLKPLVGQQNPRLKELSHLRDSLSAQIEDQILDEQRRLRERIAAQKERVANLELEVGAETRKLIVAQSSHDELALLNHEAQFRQNELTALQAAASRARQHGQMSFLNIVVLDKALPPAKPSYPNTTVALIESPALGALLGVIMALLVEAFDRRIRLASDLEFAMDAPVLGRIPRARRHGRRRAIAAALGRLAAVKSAWARRPGLSRAC